MNGIIVKPLLFERFAGRKNEKLVGMNLASCEGVVLVIRVFFRELEYRDVSPRA